MDVVVKSLIKIVYVSFWKYFYLIIMHFLFFFANQPLIENRDESKYVTSYSF